MDIVLRAVIIYLLVFTFTRVLGRRELATLQPFDFILLVVIGDLIQSGVTQNDLSVTGVIIVVYLYLHLGVLSMLLIGRSAWSSFLGVVTAKGFLALEAVLIAAVLFHALNGIRVALVGSGIVADRQRALWWSLGVFGTIVLVVAGLHIFGSK